MRQTPSIILVVLCSLIFISSTYLVFFYNPNKTDADLIVKSYSELLDSLSKGVPDSIHLKGVVHFVSTYESVECGFLGYAGRKSTQFDPTPVFKTMASDSQLINYIDTKNAIVKYFAFTALFERNPYLCKSVLFNHLYDKDSYKLYCGCIIDSHAINLYFFQTISNILSPSERKFCQTELKKQYKYLDFNSPFMVF